MLKYRNFVSFISTILLYLGIGILFFYLQHTTIGTEQKPQEKIISFTLSEYEPEIMPPIEETILPKEQEIIEPEPEPIKEEVKEEEPIVEEKKLETTVAKVIPKSLVKKIVKKKIVKNKKIKKKIKKRVHKKVVYKKIRKRVKQAKRLSKRKTSPAKKNRFLNQLRAKINRYKAYPRIAQRRGMQGTVKVRFTILANGQVGNISVSGPKVFHTSAKGAVKKAFPIVTKNAPLSLPTTVNLTLRYQIR